MVLTTWIAAAGLPIGLQLMARPWAEAQLLYLGSVLEAASSGANRLPQLHYDVLHGQ